MEDILVSLCTPKTPLRKFGIARFDRCPSQLYNELVSNFSTALTKSFKINEMAHLEAVQRIVQIEYPCERNPNGCLKLEALDTKDEDSWILSLKGMELGEVGNNVPKTLKLAEIAYNTFLGTHLPISGEIVHPAVRDLGLTAQEYFVTLQNTYRKFAGLPTINKH